VTPLKHNLVSHRLDDNHYDQPWHLKLPYPDHQFQNQVARWLKHEPSPVPLVMAHVEANAQLDFEIDDQDMATLNAMVDRNGYHPVGD